MTLSYYDVFIVDDDALIRYTLQQLFKSVGLKVNTFSTADEFLSSGLSIKPGCLVLDIQMPGMNGLDLQSELVKRGVSIPIIFITTHSTESMKLRAIKAGAVDFLYKPFDEQKLLDAVYRAIGKKTAI